jgi:pyrroline-5-carboxylate reductase
MIGTVGIIGVGHLATYLVEGLRRAGSPQAPHASGGSPVYSPATACPRDIVLSPRNADRAARLAARYGALVAASNQAVVDAADLVILSTRPGDVVAAIAGVAFRPGQAVVSVVASLPLKVLQPMVTPAMAVRAMPLSCAAINRSPTLLYPDHPPAHALFTLLGHVHPLPDESSFTSASVISAFYGWTYALLDEVVAWTVQAGVPPETARSLVLEAVRGAADVALAQPNESLAAILDTLATPGGITEQGLRILHQRQGLTAWSQALEALLDRLHGPMVEANPRAACSGLETSIQ